MLAHYNGVAQDESGNAQESASVQVVNEITAAPPQLYSDVNGDATKGNPFTSNADGSYDFYVASGFYKIVVTKGAISKTLRWVPIGTAAGYALEQLINGQLITARVATTANITIATALNDGDAIDGVTLADGDVVLVKDQTDPADNRIIVVDATPEDHAAFTTFADFHGARVAVSEGDVNAGRVYLCTAALGGSLGVDPLPFTRISTIAGPPGEPGATGPSGPNTGLDFAWSTATSGDPGSGKVLGNNATLASITQINISKTGRNGESLGATIGAWGDGTTSGDKGHLRIFTLADRSEYIEAKLTAAPSDQSTYWVLTVTIEDADGSPSANDIMAVMFERTGNAGAGSDGANGASALTIVTVVDTDIHDPATDYEAGDEIDGHTLQENETVLRVTPAGDDADGLYVVPASGAASRHSGFPSFDSYCGAEFNVQLGDDYAATKWRCISEPGGTLDTDPIEIQQQIALDGNNNLSELTNVVAARINLGVRDVLTTDRTYYVRTDGNDSNDGLSDTSGGAFLTIQKAIDVVAALDISIYDVLIQVGAGTYTAAITLKNSVGAGTVTLRGDTTTPANVLLSVTSANAIAASNVRSNWVVEGFEVRTTTSGNCIQATTSALTLGVMRYGASAGYHIFAAQFSRITASANYTISGNAMVHWSVNDGALIQCNGRTITISGTPAFSTAFALGIRGGLIQAISNTYSGSATGARYNVQSCAVIDTSGAGTTALPGNSSGTGTNPGASPYGLYQ